VIQRQRFAVYHAHRVWPYHVAIVYRPIKYAQLRFDQQIGFCGDIEDSLNAALSTVGLGKVAYLVCIAIFRMLFAACGYSRDLFAFDQSNK
jgi:hypothetical protein